MSSACTMEVPTFAPDAGVDANEPDASEATQLVVAFEAKPGIPFTEDGPFAIALDGVHIDLHDVRAIGDAGSTAASELSLDWNDVLIPSPYIARGAAPGLYSQVRASAVKYEMYGTVLLGDERVPFEIIDSPPPSFSIEMTLVDCVVEAGQMKQSPVHFHSKDVVKEIAWDTVARASDGVLRIDGSDPTLLAKVREELADSFERDSD